MWGIPKIPKKKLWGVVKKSMRQSKAVRATEKTDNGPLWPFPRPVWAPFSGQWLTSPAARPFQWSNSAIWWVLWLLTLTIFWIPLPFHYTFRQFRKRGVWSIFVLQNLVRVKRNERKAWRFPSPSVTSRFRAALSPPPAPRRTLWWGQGAVGAKGQGEGDATHRRSDLTWLCIKCPNLGRKLSGQQLESPCPAAPPPPCPARRCVLFKNSVEFRPMDSSVVSGIAENSPGHVSLLLFYW